MFLTIQWTLQHDRNSSQAARDRWEGGERHVEEIYLECEAEMLSTVERVGTIEKKNKCLGFFFLFPFFMCVCVYVWSAGRYMYVFACL